MEPRAATASQQAQAVKWGAGARKRASNGLTQKSICLHPNGWRCQLENYTPRTDDASKTLALYLCDKRTYRTRTSNCNNFFHLIFIYSNAKKIYYMFSL